MKITKEEKLLKFVFESNDVDFCETFLINLTDEEVQKFFNENPDYMAGLPVNDISLLRDKMWRNILREIEKNNKMGKNQDIASILD